MSRFSAPLVVTPLNDGRTWRILYSTTDDAEYPETAIDFGYDVGEEGSEQTIKPVEGFETDFTSVPRLLWWLLPRWGRYGNAAIIHDYLYRGGAITGPGSNWILPNRKRSDEIFLEAMTVLEVSWWQKWPLYWGVRAFGWAVWMKS